MSVAGKEPSGNLLGKGRESVHLDMVKDSPFMVQNSLKTGLSSGEWTWGSQVGLVAVEVNGGTPL